MLAPFESKPVSALVDTDVTGSISPRASRSAVSELQPGQVSLLSPKLDAEDWRRAKAALATALDPQGNGGHVRWENPESKAKGSFAPIGNPFLIKDEICRIFVTMLSVEQPDQWFQGSACRASASEWVIRDIKDWKKPG